MTKLVKVLFILSLILGMIIAFFPSIDLEFSKMFYDLDKGFFYKRNAFVVGIYKSIPIISNMLAFGILCLISVKYIFLKKFNLIIKLPIVYLLIALALGPGFVVNYALKENFGRARPSQVKDFGGVKEFTAPLVISGQCTSNCSFSSGHAASGYYLTAFSWIIPKRRNIIFLLGFIFGSMVGLGRIAQGGHFFSDVIFSFIFIIISNEISYRFWRFLKSKYKGKDVI